MTRQAGFVNEGHGHDDAVSDDAEGNYDEEHQDQGLALDGAMGEASRVPFLTAITDLCLTQLPPAEEPTTLDRITPKRNELAPADNTSTLVPTTPSPISPTNSHPQPLPSR